MAKRVIQPATSATRRTRRVAKPTTPWVRGRLTDVPKELQDANPDLHFRWVYKDKNNAMATESTRTVGKRNEGYVDPVIPKDKNVKGNTSAMGGYHRKDCVLLGLPRERKEARDYYIQERSEQHLLKATTGTEEMAKKKNYLAKGDSIDFGDE